MFNQNKKSMKRLSLILLSVAIAVSGVFTSCTEDTDTGFDDPSVEVLYSSTGSSDVPVQDGDTIKKAEGTNLSFDVKFTTGDAGDKLTKVKITSKISGKTYNIVDSLLDEGLFNSGAKTFTYSYETSVGSAVEEIVFSIIDKKDREGSAVVYVKPTVVTPAGSVKTTEAIIMGSYANALYNSCYSLTLNKTVSLQGGFSQPAEIDLLYYFGATNKSTLAAPSNASLEQVYTNATYGIAKWSTRRATKLLKTSVTASTFDGITTSTAFTSAFPADMTAALDLAKELAVGNVIAMKTAGNKTALIKVVEINGTTSSGYIKITIKTVL